LVTTIPRTTLRLGACVEVNGHASGRLV
jgi:hypothetical protein